jgi:signal transduction histidine kinase
VLCFHRVSKFGGSLAPQIFGQIGDFLLRERGDQGAPVRRLWVGIAFGLAVTLIIIAGKALDTQVYAQGVASLWIRHTRDVELTITRLLGAVVTAESAVRGYAITGKPEYLGSLDEAKVEAPLLLKSLRDMTVDNPSRSGQLYDIAALITQKFAFLDQAIAAKQDGPAALGALIAKGRGKLIMDELRSKSDEVIRDEERLLIARQSLNDAAIVHGIWLARITAIVGIGLLCAAFGWVALAMYFRGVAERAARAAIAERDAADALRKKHEAQILRDQSAQTVGRLAAGLAHVLNNALTVIMGQVELMAEQAGRPQADRKSLMAISVSAGTARELTDKFRSFGQRQMFDPEDVDLNELLGDLKRLTGAMSTGVPVEVMPGPASLKSFVDRRQLLTALTAIFENAIEAMPHGGQLTLRCTKVRLTDSQAIELSPGLAAGEYAEITVADTGCGMSDEVRRHVFEPFYTTKDFSEGAGLGLAMAYGFAKQSRGHIWLESAVGIGTTVRLLLPTTHTNVEVLLVPVHAAAQQSWAT